MYFPPSFQRYQCDGHSKAPKKLAKKKQRLRDPTSKQKKVLQEDKAKRKLIKNKRPSLITHLVHEQLTFIEVMLTHRALRAPPQPLLDARCMENVKASETSHTLPCPVPHLTNITLMSAMSPQKGIGKYILDRDIKYQQSRRPRTDLGEEGRGGKELRRHPSPTSWGILLGRRLRRYRLPVSPHGGSRCHRYRIA